MVYSLEEIAQRIGARIVGDPQLCIRGLGTIKGAKSGDLTHLSSPQYRSYLKDTQASAVILSQADAADCPVDALVVGNPGLAYALASQLFINRVQVPEGVSSHAEVHPSVALGEGVRIGPFVSIGPDTVIGDRVEVSAGTHISAHCKVGDDTLVMPNVVLYQDVKIGRYCVIHANSGIGADGFGFTPDESHKLESVAQLGGVTIGDSVVVGASNTIDRGAIDDTVIEDGVKLDDQVHIGHNCHVGAHSLLCGCTGLGGSVTIGKHCFIGGGVGIAGTGPLTIADGTQVGAMTYVSRSIPTSGVFAGSTLHAPIEAWRRNMMRLSDLDNLAKRIARLERREKHDE